MEVLGVMLMLFWVIYMGAMYALVTHELMMKNMKGLALFMIILVSCFPFLGLWLLLK